MPVVQRLLNPRWEGQLRIQFRAFQHTCVQRVFVHRIEGKHDPSIASIVCSGHVSICFVNDHGELIWRFRGHFCRITVDFPIQGGCSFPDPTGVGGQSLGSTESLNISVENLVGGG